MGVGGPGQAHEAARVLLDVIERGGGPGELRLRDQATEVLVPLPLLHEERQPRAVPERQLAADDRAEPELRHGPIEPRGAVDAVTVHEGEGGHLEPRRRLGERLRLLRRLEERKRRLRVQLYKHGSAHGHPSPRLAGPAGPAARLPHPASPAGPPAQPRSWRILGPRQPL